MGSKSLVLCARENTDHMIKWFNNFYACVKLIGKKRGNDNEVYIQKSFYHRLKWPYRAENGAK